VTYVCECHSLVGTSPLSHPSPHPPKSLISHRPHHLSNRPTNMVKTKSTSLEQEETTGDLRSNWLLDLTSGAWLCVLNVAITCYRQWTLLVRDSVATQVAWSMHAHILLMQLIMAMLAVLVYGQSKMPLVWHRRIGKLVAYVFLANAPFALHLAWLMLQRRHWWHSLVQVTSLVVSYAQLRRVYRAARNKDIKRHRFEVRGLAAVINGAAGSRLLGNVYQFALGFDEELSYTLGLTTMFCTFLVPRILAMLRMDSSAARIAID
jgi:hypothetical protein